MTSTLRFRNNLDRDVYQIVRKLEAANDERPFKTVTAAYEAIKRSNSSLSRQKKRPLEDAIDRALRIRKQEQQDSDDSEAAIDKSAPPKPGDDRFLLNRQMTKLWNMKSRDDEPPVVKKRRLQPEAEINHEERVNGTTNGAETTANASASEAAVVSAKDQQVSRKSSRLGRFSVEQPGQLAPLGGLDDVYNKTLRLSRQLLLHYDGYKKVGFQPASGILLSGPPGVGKKTLVKNLASSLGVPLISLARCFYDLEKMERSLTEAFDTAINLAPSIVFIEQLDRWMPRPASSGQDEHQSRALSYLADQMARVRNKSGLESHVLALATTSKIMDINPAILKRGFFERSINIRIPDGPSRLDILKVLTKKPALSADVHLPDIADMTHGYVGSDLGSIIDLAGDRSYERFLNTQKQAEGLIHADMHDQTMLHGPLSCDPSTGDMADISGSAPEHAEISMDDFKAVVKDYVPSLRMEGFTVIPNVTWNQVGAMEAARKQLRTSIIGPIKQPGLHRRFGLVKPAGVLLWGPPGCGKTLVAQAVANEAQASFILINGPELLNKYVGESERAVRELFQRARSSTPCILFFDEIDSIAPPRSNSSTESGARVVNALLTELDGAQDRTGIYVIATTNRPEMIDEAMLRPGRLSVQILVDLPTAAERVDILRAIYRTYHEDASPDVLEGLATVALDPRCNNFSGADLSGLHTKSAEHALERWIDTGTEDTITAADWEFGLANSRASVRDVRSYKPYI